MKRSFPSTLLLWALRDLLRHPAKTLLNATALVILTFFAGTALLAGQALTDSTQRLLAQAPALVVRRISAGGWMPIPIRQAMGSLRKVPGIINPRARIWGTVAGSQGPLTILAMDDKIKAHLIDQHLPLPKPGQAIIGSGILQASLNPPNVITLTSNHTLHLEIIATLSAATDMVSRDMVIATPQDVRHILNIPESMASDLALDVFHQDEAEALLPELVEAFPWPVSITSLKETQKHLFATFARKGSVATILFIPGILALVLLILASGHDVLSRRNEAGLLRTLGWTTFDLTRMQLSRSLLICLPSIIIGQTAAYLVVFTPVIKWVGRFLPGWPYAMPAYHLSSMGAGLIIAELLALIAIPYTLASLWPVLVLAAKDPLSLLKGESFR